MPTMIDRFARTYQEVAGSSFYRSHPWESLLFAYSKWKFSRTRMTSAKSFLRNMGIDPERALSGFERWRPVLEGIISEETVRQGGVGMEDGIILYSIARELRPEYVIETGVASGISSSFIAAALIENSTGTLFSMELPPPVNALGFPCSDGSIYEGAVRPAGWAIPREIRDEIGDRHTCCCCRMCAEEKAFLHCLTRFPTWTCSCTTICTPPITCYGNTNWCGQRCARAACWPRMT